MVGPRSLRALLPALWLALVAAPLLNAQVPANGSAAVAGPAAPSAAENLRQQASDLQKQLEAATDLPEEARTRGEAALKQSQDNLKAAQDADIRALQLTEQLSRVDAEARELQASLSRLKEQPEPRIDPYESPETQLAKVQQELVALTAQRSSLLDPQQRTTQRRALREQLVKLPQQIAVLAAEAQTPPATGDPALVGSLLQLQAQTRKLALERQLAAVEAELGLYDAEDPLDVPRFRRELIDLGIARGKRFADALEQEVSRVRRAVAANRVREAETVLAELPLEVRGFLAPVVENTLAFAQEEVAVRQERQRYQARLESARTRLSDVQKHLEQAEQRVKRVGLTPSLGLRLRRQRQELEDPYAIRRRVQSRFATLEEAQLKFLDHTDRLKDLADLDATARELLQSMNAELTSAGPADRRRFAADVRRELDRQHSYLSELVAAYSDYTTTLDALDADEDQLILDTERFIAFIDEHILWIRSHRPLGKSSLSGDKLTLLWLLRARFPPEVAEVLLADVRAAPVWWILVLGAGVVLIVRGSKLRRRMREWAKLAEGRSQTEMKPTLRAWGLTALISLPWPGLMLFLGWRLTGEAASNEVSAFGRSLMSIGVAFLALEFFRQTWRSGGLAESHFQWSSRSVELLRRTFRRLTLLGLPLGVVAAALHARERSGAETDAIEMLLFIAALCLITWCVHRLLHPRTGVLRDFTAYHPSGWIDRTRGVFWLAGAAVPVALIIMTAIGYYYTAQRLVVKVEITAYLLLSILFIRAMLYRWLMLRHRRLRIEQLRQRRAAAQEAAAEDAAVSDIPEIAVDQEADLHTISRQTERLVNSTLLALAVVGVWLTWVDVLPALNYLDRWWLWETYETVQESAPANGGLSFPDNHDQPRLETTTRVTRITVVHLLWCVLLVMFTFTAARNLPGLLEISLLQRLPLDASVRYAITAVTRYVIVLLGIVFASQAIGIGWAKVQWLAAALTVGLGFGLQEIFANFVSGLIILFEQPLRVGDIVTIDNVSGIVSRIRIRSTTITDWDRKEYVVPNKEFITGKLLNWTLSDTTTRIVINVGVAYGSDPEEVTRILTRIVEQHPAILRDPPPYINFDSFGDSALNFVVRVFLPTLDKRLPTVHDLNTSIHRELAKAGIEIPFPQRDLYIRSMPDAAAGLEPSRKADAANERQGS